MTYLGRAKRVMASAWMRATGTTAQTASSAASHGRRRNAAAPPIASSASAAAGSGRKKPNSSHSARNQTGSAAAVVVPAAPSVLACSASVARPSSSTRAAPMTNIAGKAARTARRSPCRARQASHRATATPCPASHSQAL